MDDKKREKLKKLLEILQGDKPKVETLKELLQMINENLTRDEFLEALKKIINQVLAIEVKVLEKTNQAINDIKSDNETLREATQGDLRDLYFKLEQSIKEALREQENSLILIRDKVNSLKDGITPVKGVDYFDGKDVDEEKIINEVLSRVSDNKEEIDEVKKDIDEIKKELERLRRRRVGGIGGNSTNSVATVYARDQYSSRFSEQISVTTVAEALDAIFDFTYVAPGISLASSPAATVKEFGDPISSVVLTATTVKRTNNITSVTFYRGASLINTVAVPDPSGGTETYTENDDVVATTSFTAKAGDGTQTTTSSAVTFTFVYPFYYGVGAQGLNAAQIQALTKSVSVQGTKSVTTSPSNQVYYFAYPAAYGALTSILDTNGFETIDDYTRSTVNFTMLDSTVQSYYVYEFNNLTTQTNFTNTFTF